MKRLIHLFREFREFYHDLRYNWYSNRQITIEIHRNLKHWGNNIEYVKYDVITPYYRFYCVFIYLNDPFKQID